MIKLRKVLLRKEIYIILFLLSVIYVVIYLNIDFTSKYKGSEKTITGEVKKLEFDNNKLTMEISAKEKILATYYLDDSEESKSLKNKISLGDTVKLNGNLTKPSSNNNFYSFSYPNYLKYKKIFYLMKVDSLEIIKQNSNTLYSLRQFVRDKISNDKVGSYIKVFFLGDDSSFDSNLELKFQKLGISHLFALSGTQISFLILILNNIFKIFHLSSKKQYVILVFIILLYSLLIDSCSAIERALVFNFLFITNKTFNFFIKPFHLILLALSILFFINPYYIFDIGFQYSTVISCALILFMKDNSKNMLVELFKVSWVSFIVSLPISLYHFSYINILSIIYNLFYVPFINIIIFPLSIISFFISKISFLLEFFINIFEVSISFLSNIDLGIIVLKRVNIIFYFLYFILIVLYLYLKEKRRIVLGILIFCLFLNYIVPKLSFDDRLYMIDVGQGDSFLLLSDNKSMLIDTGGVMSFYRNGKSNKGHMIVQFLYKIGISKIDYLLLSHGDYDHAGEALNIIDEIKVDNILFNSNKLNSLEKSIWDSNGSYKYKLKTGDKFSLGNFNFEVISGKFDDENKGSTVLYTTIFNKSILFMGDADIDSEEYILDNYDISNINILKVGHHGSLTSSSENFIKSVNPQFSLISAGVDNKFSHPNEKVVKRLEDNNSIIYDTRINGMVLFKIKKDKLEIETCVGGG